MALDNATPAGVGGQRMGGKKGRKKLTVSDEKTFKHK